MVNAGAAGTVILSGTYSGSFTGSGAGAVDLSNFTGSAVTLNFTGTVLQVTPTQDGRNLAGTITNSGSMTIATTTLPNNPVSLAGTLTNTGSIIVTGSDNLNANANGTTIDNRTGTTFTSRAPARFRATASPASRSTMPGRLSDPAARALARSRFRWRTLAQSLGTQAPSTSPPAAAASNDTITASGSGLVLLSGNYSGTFAGSGTGSVQLTSFTGTGTNGATLDFTGNVLQWNSGGSNGPVTNTGTLTIAGTSNLPLTGTLTNSGTIIVTNTNQIFANAGGTTINNSGTLESLVGSATATIAVFVNDTGTIAGNSGTLNLTSGGSGPGIVNAASGANVLLSGTYSGSLTGSGAGRLCCRTSRDRRRRSISPAMPCNGRLRSKGEFCPGPLQTPAR